MADELGSMADMFSDLSFETLTSSPKPASTTVPEKAGSGARVANPAQMMTLRGMNMNLDDLILSEEKKRKWKNKYDPGDEVEAVWAEDGQFYLARIDEVLDEPQKYRLTFIEYGNEQITEEEQMRLTLAKQLELSQKVATMEAAKKARPPARAAAASMNRAPSVESNLVKRRTSESTANSMSAAFAAMLSSSDAVDAKSVTASVGPTPPPAVAEAAPAVASGGMVDYASLKELPPLPAEPPSIENQAAYKDFMRLRYEYQRRGLPVPTAEPNKDALAPPADGGSHKRSKSLGRAAGERDIILNNADTQSPKIAAKPSRFSSAFRKK